jgi:hypothetical protein
LGNIGSWRKSKKERGRKSKKERGRKERGKKRERKGKREERKERGKEKRREERKEGCEIFFFAIPLSAEVRVLSMRAFWGT